MKVSQSTWICAFAISVFSLPAFAQDGSAEPFSRASVSAIAGVALTDDRSPMLAIEYTERVHELVQAYANLTYFDDLMTPQTRQNLGQAAALLVAATGNPWHFEGRDQGVSFTVGAKAVAPLGAVRPYIGAGAGALNLRRKIRETSLGDVTDSFVELFGSGDGNVGTPTSSGTKPLAEAVVGLNVVAGRTSVDLSYRYRRAFHTVTRLDFSQVGVGVGIRF